MDKTINEPSEEIKIKMIEFFLATSVPRIIDAEFTKKKRIKYELYRRIED